MTRKNFSLIELLVVLAIFAVLSSLLLPSLRKTFQQAESSQCIYHLRQLGVGTMLFAEDNNSTTPPMVDWLGTGTSWQSQISYYVNDLSVFDCPSETRYSYSKDNPYAGTDFWRERQYGGPGYGYNSVHINVGQARGPEPPSKSAIDLSTEQQYRQHYRSFNSFENSAELILFGDNGNRAIVMWGDATVNRLDYPQYSVAEHNTMSIRHLGGAGYVFADGHARNLLPDEIICETERCWWSTSHGH